VRGLCPHGARGEDGFLTPADQFGDNQVSTSQGTIRPYALLLRTRIWPTPECLQGSDCKGGWGGAPERAAWPAGRAVVTDWIRISFCPRQKQHARVCPRQARARRQTDCAFVSDGFAAWRRIVVTGLQRVRPGAAVHRKRFSMAIQTQSIQ